VLQDKQNRAQIRIGSSVCEVEAVGKGRLKEDQRSVSQNMERYFILVLQISSVGFIVFFPFKREDIS
jgi:hypothetical protein